MKPETVYYCTYHGALNSLIDSAWEMSKEYDPEGLTEEELESIDYDAWLSDFIDAYRNHVQPILNKTLKPYGIQISGFNLDRPRYYNYRGDAITCVATFESINLERIESELKDYLENVRRKSRDGFISFEPSALHEIDPSEGSSMYSIFWAILTQANAWDDLIEAHNDVLEHIQCNGITPDQYITLTPANG